MICSGHGHLCLTGCSVVTIATAYIEISAHFGIESVENLIANRRNRFIDRYGETDNYLRQMLRWLVRLSECIFYLLRLFNFCLLIFFHLCCATIYDGEIKLYILLYERTIALGTVLLVRLQQRASCRADVTTTTRASPDSADFFRSSSSRLVSRNGPAHDSNQIYACMLYLYLISYYHFSCHILTDELLMSVVVLLVHCAIFSNISHSRLQVCQIKSVVKISSQIVDE